MSEECSKLPATLGDSLNMRLVSESRNCNIETEGQREASC